MRLTTLERAPVDSVVRRAHDLEEVFALRGHHNVSLLVDNVMAHASFAWLAWDEQQPTAVFGAAPAGIDGIWSTFLLTTPDFGKIALPLTRFVKKGVIPVLFGELRARRLQADLHEKHVHIHRWVKTLGAKEEGPMAQWSPDGSTYLRFALCRPPRVDKSDNSC